MKTKTWIGQKDGSFKKKVGKYVSREAITKDIAGTDADTLLTTYLDGLEASIDGRGWGLVHQNAYAKIVRAINSHERLLDSLKKMTNQIDKHFYSLPEENENDGKYWKRLYESACDIIDQAEGK